MKAFKILFFSTCALFFVTMCLLVDFVYYKDARKIIKKHQSFFINYKHKPLLTYRFRGGGEFCTVIYFPLTQQVKIKEEFVISIYEQNLDNACLTHSINDYNEISPTGLPFFNYAGISPDYAKNKEILIYGRVKNAQLSSIQYQKEQIIYKHFDRIIIVDNKNKVIKTISSFRKAF